MLVVKSHIGGVKTNILTFFGFLCLLIALWVCFYSFIQWITGFLLANKPLLFIIIYYYYIILFIYY